MLVRDDRKHNVLGVFLGQRDVFKTGWREVKRSIMLSFTLLYQQIRRRCIIQLKDNNS
nr:hypothetical protein Iba_chr06bCG7900 [Ipomoea batatas]GMD07571.1 hypothetical protein Iba_chr06cCG8470 [Ipomoea batatas]GMD10523.1 hypothetical protein Iba_chr06eCG7080 [Ipomoea batatas]GMD62279.1 hypothetical protein Iba_chr12bCG3910 [Ipomoea batatas]